MILISKSHKSSGTISTVVVETACSLRWSPIVSSLLAAAATSTTPTLAEKRDSSNSVRIYLHNFN